MSEFIRSTVGLQCSHPNLNKPQLIRVEFYREEDDSITLKAVNGHNLGLIHKIEPVTITWDEYVNSPEDPYDSLVEAYWSLDKLGFY